MIRELELANRILELDSHELAQILVKLKEEDLESYELLLKVIADN